MNMKSVTAGLLSFLLLSMPAAFADEASKNAKIEELLQVMHSDQTMSQVFDQMKAMQLAELSKMNVAPERRQAIQEAQQRGIKRLQDTLSWDKMKPMMVKIYAETFTEEEIDSVLNFYKSPAGQAFLRKMPLLMQRTMAASQQMVADAMSQAGQQTGAGNPPPPPPPSNVLPAGAVRIDRQTAEANLLDKIEPQYPPLAVQAGVRGDVDFTITIDQKGHVINAQLVRGHPILVAAARDAVLQWTYRPILRDGQPVTAVANVTVTFR